MGRKKTAAKAGKRQKTGRNKQGKMSKAREEAGVEVRKRKAAQKKIRYCFFTYFT